MQCGELMYRNVTIMTQGSDSVDNSQKKPEKETIHSGHFMVSHFEAEAQDDEYDVAVPLPEEESKLISAPSIGLNTQTFVSLNYNERTTQQVSIETSLTKLFQCMSLAYRQKLTSPKWNRFKGIRLRWKDKIRLNNVIWRCWHMQFIRKQNTMVCQFASPLDVDTHNKPEAVVLEGKYWKRKLAAVTAEYKKWRMFYRNRLMGWSIKDGPDVLTDMDMFDWQPHSNDSVHSMGSMMVDEDYMEFMSDTLFSTIQSNQPFAFPDTREIARGASLADFIQPSLVQLQPNLDDFMDTLEPLQDLVSLSSNFKLPSVPEECVSENIYRPIVRVSNNSGYQEVSILDNQNALQVQLVSAQQKQIQQQQQQQIQQQQQQQLQLQQQQQQQQQLQQQQQQRNLQYTATIFAQPEATSEYPSSTSLINRTNTFVQGPISYEESSQTPVQVPVLGRRGSRSGARTARITQQVPLYTYQSVSPPSVQQYRYPLPSPPSPNTASLSPPLKQPMRSNSLSGTEEEMFAIPKYNHSKHRTRSRSGSSLGPGSTQRQHPPPLVSAASDPSLPTITSSNLQPLLAHLLSNSSASGVFNFTASSDLRSTPVVPILPMPSQSSGTASVVPQTTTTTLLITTPVSMSQVQGTSGPSNSPNQILVNSLGSSSKSSYSPDSSAVPSPPGLSLSPLPSPLNMSPLSPPKPLLSRHESGSLRMRRTDSTPPKEHRRECHTKAEHKRRCNIKNGFDMLHSLIPQLHQNPNAKLSKAAMLQKGADYIQQLRAERDQLREEMLNLKQEIDCLNVSISNCQSMLPATGAPVSRQRASKMKEMFDEYVRIRTLENWKFWIFSILFEPLLNTYNSSVSTASLDDLYRSTLHWVEQHCSLVDLRPAVLTSLRYLSTTTEILSDPSKLPEEARQAVMKQDRQ